MRRLRFRPFGVAGSLSEVLVGLYIVDAVAWTEESYSSTFTALGVTAGILVMAVGLVGLLHAARGRARRRSA